MKQFEYDSIVAHVARVSQKKKKGKGKDAEPQLRVFVHFDVTDPAESNPVLSDLLDMEVHDVVEWRETNAQRLRSATFAQRFVQRKVNLRYGAEVLSSIGDAVVDSFRVDMVADVFTFRVTAVTNGLQIGALSELIGTKVRLEVVSLQGELELPDPEPPKTTRKPRKPRVEKKITAAA